jgi:MFS family permease
MKLFEKNELRLLWPFYLDAMISPMLFFAPAFFIIFFTHLQLNFFQIGILLAVPSLAVFIFEIPTGAIADLYGRKFSVLLGYFLEGVGFLMLFFIRSYEGILIIFALYGIAATFSSGSKEAWIIDLIKSKNKKLVHNYFVKSKFLDSCALIISGLIGAVIVKYFGISIMFIFASLSFLISISILMFAKEYFIKRKAKVRDSFKNVFNQSKKSIHYSVKHPVLFYFILAGFFIVFTGAFSSSISWTPLLQGLNFPDYAFGYMWSAMLAVTAIAPLFARKFLGKGKEIAFFIKMSAMAALLFLLVYFAKSWAYALAVLLISEFFWEIQTPVSMTYFHKFIPSKLRATIGSSAVMVWSLAGIIAIPLAGGLVDLLGAKYVIMISALFVIPAVILYLRIKEKR